ncbi:MAG: hypothetical protein QNI91_12635 [Arenicellales bacterium]|nr:hypothetical protein [Arenicellales bacterium]
MKKSISLFGVALIILSVTACGRLNERIDHEIEEVGQDLTEEPVKVERVKIRLGGGSGQIKGLTIPNPEGYEADNAFEMDLLRINIGVFASLDRPPIVLDELVIDSPTLNLELNDRGGSNLKDIADTVQKNSEQAGHEPVEEKSESDDGPKKPTRIAVRKLLIKDVTFSLRRADGTFRSGTLPTIELTDVGGDEGKTPAGLGATVVIAMAGEMLKQAVAHKLVEGLRFDGEKVLSLLDQRLALTAAQQAEVKVVAEKISQSLNDAIERWIEEGFIDLALLSEDLEPVAEEAKNLMKDILDNEQMQEFQSFLANLDEEAVDTIRTALVDRLADGLVLKDEQKVKLRPILRQHLESVGELLSEFANNPERSIEAFKADYNALQSDTRQKLQDVLSADQLVALTERQDEVRDRIQGIFFSEN